jgi:hypothetical protein
MTSQFVALPGGDKFRFFTPREVCKAQGFPHSFKLDQCNNTARKYFVSFLFFVQQNSPYLGIYSQLGNAVPPPLVCSVAMQLLEAMGFSVNFDKHPDVELAFRALGRPVEPGRMDREEDFVEFEDNERNFIREKETSFLAKVKFEGR